MRKEMKILSAIMVIVIVSTSAATIYYFSQLQNKQNLVISTTTSLYDTGLLDLIKQRYEQSNPKVLVKFISAGTGIAITHAKKGDADLILVHSPSQELAFMEEGYGVNRRIFAYNFFTIIGPSYDPAGIHQTDPIEAFQRIYEYGNNHGIAVWVSRDDLSGTNSKEIALWNAAGFDYEVIREELWFVSSGTGMGASLRLADERDLYSLSDIGTYLKYFSDGLIRLAQHVDQGEALLNVYSAIVVNPQNVSNVKYELAMEFVLWLVSENVQQLIGEYGVSEYGSQLFFPAVQILQSQLPNEIYTWIRDHAFFEAGGLLFECPPQWQMGGYSLSREHHILS